MRAFFSVTFCIFNFSTVSEDRKCQSVKQTLLKTNAKIKNSQLGRCVSLQNFPLILSTCYRNVCIVQSIQSHLIYIILQLAANWRHKLFSSKVITHNGYTVDSTQRSRGTQHFHMGNHHTSIALYMLVLHMHTCM